MFCISQLSSSTQASSSTSRKQAGHSPTSEDKRRARLTRAQGACVMLLHLGQRDGLPTKGRGGRSRTGPGAIPEHTNVHWRELQKSLKMGVRGLPRNF